MITYTETELLRLARIRTDVAAEQRLAIQAEAQRLAAQARADAVVAALRFAGRALGRLVARLAAWRRYRVALAELQALDPRMLGDIGITRAEIPRVAAGLWAPETAVPAATAPVQGKPGNDNARQAAA
jgi:uncharacterized protein YjiS (DUF1127 family)